MATTSWLVRNPRVGYDGKLSTRTHLGTLAAEYPPLQEHSLSQGLPRTIHERDEKRIHVAIPIRITCFDERAQPRLEMACTYDISAHGARITGLRSVLKEGEILVVERGRNKAYCRVAWIGASDSPLRGQVGIQSVESGRGLWEAELRDMREVYDPIARDGILYRMNCAAGSHNGNRRRQPRFCIAGVADIVRNTPETAHLEATLKDVSECGCLVSTKELLSPGTSLKLVLKIARLELGFKGEVRHAAEGLGVGIEFREVRKGDRAVLLHMLRGLSERAKDRGPTPVQVATVALPR